MSSLPNKLSPSLTYHPSDLSTHFPLQQPFNLTSFFPPSLPVCLPLLPIHHLTYLPLYPPTFSIYQSDYPFSISPLSNLPFMLHTYLPSLYTHLCTLLLTYLPPYPPAFSIYQSDNLLLYLPTFQSTFHAPYVPAFLVYIPLYLLP